MNSDNLELKRIQEILIEEGINSALVFSIEFKVPSLVFGYLNSFSIDTVVENEDQTNICWFQSNNHTHLLRYIQEGKKFEWIPESRNGEDWFMPILLEWYIDHVIFIYEDEYGIFVSSSHKGKVNLMFIHGCEIARKEGLLSFETFTDKIEDHYKVIELPSLKALDPIQKEEAKKLGLEPKEWMKQGDNLKG